MNKKITACRVQSRKPLNRLKESLGRQQIYKERKNEHEKMKGEKQQCQSLSGPRAKWL